MTEKKILFFDIDDTLVHHRGDRSYIPDSTRETLQKLQEAGHIVAIATGRGHFQMAHIMEMLNLSHAVCFNGHEMVFDGKIVHRLPLHKEDTQRLMRRLRFKIYPFLAVDESSVYIKDFLGTVRRTMKREVKEVEGTRISDYSFYSTIRSFRRTGDRYFAMMFFWNSFKDEASYPNLSFKKWGRRGFEVGNIGISKLSGIHWMADHFGMDYKDIVVFGDNYNDLEMLEGIENSVAMGNAVSAAKEAASYVTDHVGSDGIAKACHHLGLIEEAWE